MKDVRSQVKSEPEKIKRKKRQYITIKGDTKKVEEKKRQKEKEEKKELEKRKINIIYKNTYINLNS